MYERQSGVTAAFFILYKLKIAGEYTLIFGNKERKH